MLVNLFLDISLLLLARTSRYSKSKLYLSFMEDGGADFNYIASQKHVRAKKRRLLSSGNICRSALPHVLVEYFLDPTSFGHLKHLNTYPPSADIHCLHHNPDHL